MAKKKTDWFLFLWMIVLGVVLIAIGSSFVGGEYLNALILSYLPQVVHTVIGYIVMIGGAITIGKPIYDKLT